MPLRAPAAAGKKVGAAPHISRALSMNAPRLAPCQATGRAPVPLTEPLVRRMQPNGKYPGSEVAVVPRVAVTMRRSSGSTGVYLASTARIPELQHGREEESEQGLLGTRRVLEIAATRLADIGR